MKDVSTYTPHVQEGIRLDANELYRNIQTTILEEVQALLPELLFNRYPDDTCSKVRDAYGRYAGLDGAHVLCGNGSDQMLGLMIGTFLGHGKTLLTLSPDFGMYDYYASSYEAQVKKYPITPGQPLNMEDFIAEAKKIQPDLILFSNPNNPTGNLLTREDVLKLVQTFPEIPVVVDEAYMDFAHESVMLDVDTYSNLYVTRTLSKAFGLAGLRIGFLISSPANIAKMDEVKVVYSVNTLTQAIACLVLDHAQDYQPIIEEIKAARDQLLEDFAQAASFKAYPSQANFILLESGQMEQLKQDLADADIHVRTYGSQNRIRITMGSPAENEAAAAILRKFEENNHALC